MLLFYTRSFLENRLNEPSVTSTVSMDSPIRYWNKRTVRWKWSNFSTTVAKAAERCWMSRGSNVSTFAVGRTSNPRRYPSRRSRSHVNPTRSHAPAWERPQDAPTREHGSQEKNCRDTGARPGPRSGIHRYDEPNSDIHLRGTVLSGLVRRICRTPPRDLHLSSLV
jgi:hypothetical protein